MGAIEEAILRSDRRGISRVAHYMPDNYCTEAARFLLDRPGPVVIATGFFILHAGSGETDGPLGAVAMGRALEQLGRPVHYVTDGPTVPVLAGMVDDPSRVIDFPWGERETSRAEARRLLDTLRPSLLIAIERVGFTQGERYLNHRGMDITLAMSKLDLLFEEFSASIGIGDTGNEIGMGNLAKALVLEDVTSYPALTKTAHTIIAGTSHWGAYGLLAALSTLTGRNLLPSAVAQEMLLRRALELGAVDAITGKQEASVDGYSLEQCAEVLGLLHELVETAVTARPRATARPGARRRTSPVRHTVP